MPLFDSREITPRGDSIGSFDLRAIAGGGPGEHDQIRFCPRDLFVGHFFAWRQNHPGAADFYKLGDPGRGTDAGLWPCFAIDAEFLFCASAVGIDGGEISAHGADEALSLGQTVHDATKHADVISNVRESARVHRQEIDGVLEQLCDGFLFVWDRTDDQGGLELKNVFDRVHVPAISEPRKVTDWRDFGTPFSDADKKVLRANGAKDRGSARGEGDDTEVARNEGLLHFTIEDSKENG